VEDADCGAGKGGGGNSMDVSPDGVDPAIELEQLRGKLAAEDEKFKGWKEENIRRKHNYVPFIMNLLTKLGEKGHLGTLLDQAEEKTRAKKK
jgi:ubiquitin carboxyl-terminal hydrolase L5